MKKNKTQTNQSYDCIITFEEFENDLGFALNKKTINTELNDLKSSGIIKDYRIMKDRVEIMNNKS